jgi:hypothetical protein
MVQGMQKRRINPNGSVKIARRIRQRRQQTSVSLSTDPLKKLINAI